MKFQHCVNVTDGMGRALGVPINVFLKPFLLLCVLLSAVLSRNRPVSSSLTGFCSYLTLIAWEGLRYLFQSDIHITSLTRSTFLACTCAPVWVSDLLLVLKMTLIGDFDHVELILVYCSSLFAFIYWHFSWVDNSWVLLFILWLVAKCSLFCLLLVIKKVYHSQYYIVQCICNVTQLYLLCSLLLLPPWFLLFMIDQIIF